MQENDRVETSRWRRMKVNAEHTKPHRLRLPQTSRSQTSVSAKRIGKASCVIVEPSQYIAKVDHPNKSIVHQVVFRGREKQGWNKGIEGKWKRRMYNENLRPRSWERQRRAYLYLRRTHSHRLIPRSLSRQGGMVWISVQHYGLVRSSAALSS